LRQMRAFLIRLQVRKVLLHAAWHRILAGLLDAVLSGELEERTPVRVAEATATVPVPETVATAPEEAATPEEEAAAAAGVTEGV